MSLSLAILNLLPIPLLDGGHLLYYVVELVKGSPVSERTMIVGQYVGLALLFTLMGLAFFNDIQRMLRVVKRWAALRHVDVRPPAPAAMQRGGKSTEAPPRNADTLSRQGQFLFSLSARPPAFSI